MKIVDVVWFTPGLGVGIIGVVLVQMDDNEARAFIGVGLGVSEEEDKQQVVNWGATFPIEATKALFPHQFR